MHRLKIKKNNQQFKDVNMTRLETWLGNEKIARLRAQMLGWYGRPICLIDCPGSVWIHADGSFTGTFQRGYFYSAMDALEEWSKRFWIESGRLQYGQCNAGFTSISDALSRASATFSQKRNFYKVGDTGVVGYSNSLWKCTGYPATGAAGGAAPGGTAHVKGDTGAMAFNNPVSGTLHLVGADVSSSIISNDILLYDRLFSVAKTMASTATEAVTGVPTRYQSTVTTDANYVGDNFLFVEVNATIANTAHNWTVCQYTNQAGTATQTLPSLTGVAANTISKFDHPISQWFAPLASGDTGIKDLTQMQCSASVATGSINFVIGHPIGFMSFPVANQMFPFDWLTNRDQAPRIYDDACLAFIEPLKPATTATSYNGRIYMCGAAA